MGREEDRRGNLVSVSGPARDAGGQPCHRTE